MRRMLMVLASAVGMALLACGVAAANTVSTDFDSFNLGTVNGQDFWKSAPPGALLPSCPATNGQYDQEVLSNSGGGTPSAFGAKSLRISNACATGEFFYQTYSKPAAPAADESQANTEYVAEFSFISTSPGSQQEGLFLSVSPDSYEGSRMSYVGLRDAPGGIQVTVVDTPEVDGEFVAFDAGVLDRAVPHTIRFWIKVNPGPDNDLVRVFIDGRDLGQCFTTWENYYRTAPEQAPPPNRNTPASIRSLQFRSGGALFPYLRGRGYLFDNVKVTTANGPGPAGCDLVIDKEADAGTVSAAGLASYRITVRNRGRAIARNVWVCDRVPRRMTFVRADRKLRRVGRQRCLLIPLLRPGQPVSFHIVLQVDADAPQGTVTNVAEITPSPPAARVADPDVPAAIVKAKATARARAAVRVLAQAARRRLPPVTG